MAVTLPGGVETELTAPSMARIAMKYVVLVPDGCADEPLDELEGRTPLEAAAMPALGAPCRAG